MLKRNESKKAGKPDRLNSGLISLPGFWKRARTGSDADTLLSEHVRLLYSSQPSSIIISAILALIYAAVQSSVIAPSLLYGWSTVIGLILLLRAMLFISWKRHTAAIKQIDTQRWIYWFRVSAITTGIIWGAGGVLLSPSGDPGHKIYASFVLAGLCAGAATTMSIDRISASGFLFSVLVPQVIFLASEGDTISLSMSILNVLFLIFLLVSVKRSGQQLDENIRLQQKATQNESRLLQMLESSPIATRIADAASSRVVFANSKYISLFETTPEQVIGILPSIYYADPEVYTEMMKRLVSGENVTNELIELRSPVGQQHVWSKWVLASYSSVEYHDKPAILGWLYDITDRKLSEDQARHMAHHDTLTGLPNRLLFLDRLQQAITSAKREQSLLAVMFLDLDRFKPVNDQYGHHTGDLLLKAVAKRILGCLRDSDTVARIGGDEFVILLLSVQTEKNALEVGNKIRHALNQPFEIEGLAINISSSSGLAVYPDHANEVKELIKRADIAMYYAKSEGRDCVKAYQAEMHE